MIRAFTLIELLVAMAVSGIVITAGYVSYGMISRNFIDFRSHSDDISQVVSLQGILSHDIHVARTVQKYSPDEIVILQNDTETVNYECTENYVLRKKSAARDTFFLPVKRMEMQFCGQEQISSGGIMDRLILVSAIHGQEFIFYFDKQYASDILMQNEDFSDGRY